MRLDSHQHFWRYDPQECPWIEGESMQGIARDFLPTDLEPELDALDLDGSVVVHAHQTLEHSRWLCEVADAHPEVVRGIVVWVDLCAPDVGDTLLEFAKHPKVCGVRHLLQWEDDDYFAMQRDFIRGVGELADLDLTYDFCVFPTQLDACAQLAEHLPEQPFVLDHLGKPYIAKAELDPWRAQIRDLAKNENVYCKVSGMVTEAEWKAWKPEDFRPYLDCVLEAFGPQRLMYGSDWPVCLVAADNYAETASLALDWTADWSEGERRGFWGENCARFYGIG